MGALKTTTTRGHETQIQTWLSNRTKDLNTYRALMLKNLDTPIPEHILAKIRNICADIIRELEQREKFLESTDIMSIGNTNTNIQNVGSINTNI